MQPGPLARLLVISKAPSAFLEPNPDSQSIKNNRTLDQDQHPQAQNASRKTTCAERHAQSVDVRTNPTPGLINPALPQNGFPFGDTQYHRLLKISRRLYKVGWLCNLVERRASLIKHSAPLIKGLWSAYNTEESLHEMGTSPDRSLASPAIPYAPTRPTKNSEKTNVFRVFLVLNASTCWVTANPPALRRTVNYHATARYVNKTASETRPTTVEQTEFCRNIATFAKLPQPVLGY